MPLKLFRLIFISVVLLCSQAWGLSRNESEECTRTGFVCDDCSTSSICYQLVDGTWVKEFVEDCSQSQQTCRESTGICTTEINEPCTTAPRVEFRCNDAGGFPDPYNCSTYHFCIPEANGTLVRQTEHCTEGTWFDTMTLACSARANGDCVPPVPTCRRTGGGSVIGNPSMYYLCLPFVTPEGHKAYAPSLYQCSGNQRYLRGSCHDPTTPLGIDDDDETCTMLGNLYVPNCRQYNVCESLGESPFPRSCQNAAFFNTATERCEAFSCDVFKPLL